MRWSNPKHLDTRVRSGFLWLPKRIGSETRWMEQATWLETFHQYDDGGVGWPATAWLATEPPTPERTP